MQSLDQYSLESLGFTHIYSDTKPDARTSAVPEIQDIVLLSGNEKTEKWVGRKAGRLMCISFSGSIWKPKSDLTFNFLYSKRH